MEGHPKQVRSIGLQGQVLHDLLDHNPGKLPEPLLTHASWPFARALQVNDLPCIREQWKAPSHGLLKAQTHEQTHAQTQEQNQEQTLSHHMQHSW